MSDNKVYTKGDVIVNDIKVGDVLYEIEYGCYFKTKVLTLPERDEGGVWRWDAEHATTGRIIKYGVNEQYAHYGPNLYNHLAYYGLTEI
jgi:hypothetical protein